MTDRDYLAVEDISGWDAFVAWIEPPKPAKRWSLHWYPRGEENESTRAIDRQKAEYDKWHWDNRIAWMVSWLKSNGFDKETITFAELREGYTEYEERGWHDKYY